MHIQLVRMYMKMAVLGHEKQIKCKYCDESFTNYSSATFHERHFCEKALPVAH